MEQNDKHDGKQSGVRGQQDMQQVKLEFRGKRGN